MTFQKRYGKQLKVTYLIALPEGFEYGKRNPQLTQIKSFVFKSHDHDGRKAALNNALYRVGGSYLYRRFVELMESGELVVKELKREYKTREGDWSMDERDSYWSPENIQGQGVLFDVGPSEKRRILRLRPHINHTHRQRTAVNDRTLELFD